MALPVITDRLKPRGRRLPPWLKRPLPSDRFAHTRSIIDDSGVATVCAEARCPNLSECWSRGTATFMILGDRCTRRCGFCAVTTAKPNPPAEDEPERLAEAIGRLDLQHVVITAVARDDLPDEGASHFARCVGAIRRRAPGVTIEILPADMHGRPELISILVEAEPEIFNHNLETVERLTPVVRRQARYQRSLDVLRLARRMSADMITKSGIMVGLGETRAELLQTFADLRGADCDLLTIGQYLQPSADHAPVVRYYEPDEFDKLADDARTLGFRSVASGPFIRSSYHAAELFAAATGCKPVPQGRSE